MPVWGIVMFRLVGAIVVACLLFATAAVGQPAFSPPEPPVFIDLAGPSVNRTGAIATLATRAARRGAVRVIAQLNAAPVRGATAAAQAAERLALNEAQDRVAARVLGQAAAGSATKFTTIPFVSLFVNADQVRRLSIDPEVVTIQEDVPFQAELAESVPLINADDVWTAGFPGTGSTVAILDTGVDKTHPMLSGKVVSEACYSTTDSTRVRSLCPAGVSESTDPGSGLNCAPTLVGCDHGTHVAGIAAGRQTSGTQPGGVARNSTIIAIQVFSRFNNPNDCFVGPPCIAAYNTDIIKALERVYSLRTMRRITAVNLSLGGGYPYGFSCDAVSPAMTTIIKSLRTARIATVIASGNAGLNGSISQPACISAAISVGSTLDTADTLSSFSNHAVQVRLLAPGSDITSSVPISPSTPTGFESKNGTSMATPHVTGAFALLRDVYVGATVDDISAALECTGVPVERAGVTRPRIDVNKARLFLLNPPNAQRIFTFDAVQEVAPWTALLGNLAWAPGLLRATAAPGWKIRSIANCNENLEVEATMQRINPDPNVGWNSGIFFKAQLHPTEKFFSGYFAGYNSRNGGEVFLNRLHAYDLKVLNGGWAHQLCTKPTRRFDPAGVNTLKVVSRGGVHLVYLNGILMCNVRDQTFGIGRVAIAGYFPNPSRGHSFEVFDVSVTPHELTPLTPP